MATVKLISTSALNQLLRGEIKLFKGFESMGFRVILQMLAAGQYRPSYLK